MVEHVYHSDHHADLCPVSDALLAFHACARHAELDVLYVSLILFSVCMVRLHRAFSVPAGCITSGGSCSSSWQGWSSHGSFISTGASALR